MKVLFLAAILCVLLAFTSSDKSPVINNYSSYTTHIIVSWSPIAEATGYEARLSKRADMAAAQTIQARDTAADFTGLDSNTVYYCQVRTAGGAWSPSKKIASASFSAVIETFNTLTMTLDGKLEPGFDWPSRRLAFRDILLDPSNSPDVLALQEAHVMTQLNDIREMLGDAYDCHVSSRDVSPRGILWKKAKFDLVSYDDNMEIVDANFTGHDGGRYTTQVLLREKGTGKLVMFCDVHVPAGRAKGIQEFRGNAARNLAQYAKKQAAKKGNIPVIILGDCNNYPNTVLDGFPSAPAVFRANGFNDSFDIALQREHENYATHVTRTGPLLKIGENGRLRIDYIFSYPKEMVGVADWHSVFHLKEGSDSLLQQPVPSDHVPVRAEMHFSY